MFIAEISPAKNADSWFCSISFCGFCNLLAFVVNYLLAQAFTESSWRWMIGVEFIPSIVFLGYFF
ncbi:MAG: MFS transporter [Draconibacterium sp.]|nr:MFS transporter [Draconibacterium sp.]